MTQLYAATLIALAGGVANKHNEPDQQMISLCEPDHQLSVGQTPAIMELQRVLYRQLTGEAMPVKEGSTADTQLQDLLDVSVGKRWLIVLDDLWDKSHESLLNCIDAGSSSKAFVTTRIRGLLQGCAEVSLNLMAPDEAVDLLLRTGQVDDADKAANDAAAQVAQLCGYLPLFLSICGGIIVGYEGSTDWQTDLLEMLQDDRLEGQQVSSAFSVRT